MFLGDFLEVALQTCMDLGAGFCKAFSSVVPVFGCLRSVSPAMLVGAGGRGADFFLLPTGFLPAASMGQSLIFPTSCRDEASTTSLQSAQFRGEQLEDLNAG